MRYFVLLVVTTIVGFLIGFHLIDEAGAEEGDTDSFISLEKVESPAGHVVEVAFAIMDDGLPSTCVMIKPTEDRAASDPTSEVITLCTGNMGYTVRQPLRSKPEWEVQNKETKDTNPANTLK